MEKKKSGGVNPTNNPFKDEKNRWYTVGLFYELTPDKSKCLYTIYETDVAHDGKVYKSLKNIYVNMDHIPGYEYDFANTYFGGWHHWEKIKTSSGKLSEVVKEWVDELEVRLRSQAAKGIIKTSLEDSPTAFHAKKWINDRGWIAQKGRPKKEDIQREAKIAAGIEKDIQDDLDRVLRVIK